MSLGKAKWERAAPARRNDFIQSSEYTNKNPPVFHRELPFSEIVGKHAEHPKMFWLLGHEYQRIWQSENVKYEKTSYPPVENESFLRRYVIRGLVKKQAERNGTQKELFKMKRFKNIPARTLNRRSPSPKEPVGK